MSKTAILTLFALILPRAVLAEDSSGLDVRTTGYFIWDGGYLKEAKLQNGDNRKSVVFGDLMGGIVLSAHPTERLWLRINPELKDYYPFPNDEGQDEQSRSARWLVYMEEAKAQWAILGDPAKPTLEAELGYMIYKENPDAKIFGDYLFRSWIYPGILFTKFNYPKAQIFGVRLGHHWNESFNQNLFVTSETKYYPFFDVSVAYTADYSYKNLVEVGAGVNFKSLIPVRPSLTTPTEDKSNDNVYKEVPFQTVTIPAIGSDPAKTVTIAPLGADSTLLIVQSGTSPADTTRIKGRGVNGFASGALKTDGMDDLTDPSTMHLLPGIQGTETKYSFAGTLFTARISFNPMNLLGRENPLGHDALKAYMETAVLGWKNYPGFYEKRRDRMPIMGGINLPTFNYLDVLAFEAEYYSSPYFPGTTMRSSYFLPYPGITSKYNTVWGDPTKVGSVSKRDDWKWGVTAKKSFKGITLVAQVGTDHTKMMNSGGNEYYDILQNPKEWYFQFRFIGGVY